MVGLVEGNRIRPLCWICHNALLAAATKAAALTETDLGSSVVACIVAAAKVVQNFED